MEATVAMILSRKGSNIITVVAEDTLADVAKLLNQHKIGACPVLNNHGQVIGIISDAGYRPEDRGERRASVAHAGWRHDDEFGYGSVGRETRSAGSWRS